MITDHLWIEQSTTHPLSIHFRLGHIFIPLLIGRSVDHLSMYLSVCLSVRLSVCLCVYFDGVVEPPPQTSSVFLSGGG